MTQALTVAVRPRKRAALLRRWRYHAWGIALVPLAPILLPALGLRVAFETWGRALDWPTPERRRFWVRLWWWYGYHGLYQIDWALKRLRARLEGNEKRCVRGKWDTASGIGERCDRRQLHRGKHHLVPDVRAAALDPDDWFAEQ